VVSAFCLDIKALERLDSPSYAPAEWDASKPEGLACRFDRDEFSIDETAYMCPRYHVRPHPNLVAALLAEKVYNQSDHIGDDALC
jgi:hypothetical protein